MGRKKTLIEVSPSQVTPRIRKLFHPDAPAGLRCFAVLDRQSRGQIWVDDPSSPKSGIVREAVFGSLYFGGELDAKTIHDTISGLKDRGDVLIGLWPEDDLWKKVPADPNYVGSVFEYNRRIAGQTDLLLSGPLPEGCRLRHLDGDLFPRSMMARYFTGVFGNVEKALERGIGLCLMRGEEILSEGSAGPSADGLVEIGVETGERYRRRGYASLVCAHLIQECEKLGVNTYWNCDARNPASIALARKLGYRNGKKYKLAAWLR
jgi:GNAT superfamily N-acetyltransferase